MPPRLSPPLSSQTNIPIAIAIKDEPREEDTGGFALSKRVLIQKRQRTADSDITAFITHRNLLLSRTTTVADTVSGGALLIDDTHVQLPGPSTPLPAPDAPGEGNSPDDSDFVDVAETPDSLTQPVASASSASPADTRPVFRCVCGKTLKTKQGYKGHLTRCQVVGLINSGKAATAAGAASASVANTSSEPTPEPEFNVAPTPPLKRSRSRKAKEQTKEQDLPDDFPPFLKDLEHQFRCLNTVHSFCQVQRQIVCTFEGLKRSVQRLSGRKLTLSDLGAVRAISPNLIVLYWAERMDLQDGTVRDMIDPEDPQHQRHALVIEFRDARPIQVKGKKRMLDTNGQTTGWRELSLADQIGPSIGTASIPVLVERRNRNFREFMINFVAAAAANSEDPIEKLRELALQAVPVQPGKLWAETEPTGTATSTNEESLEADLDRPTDLIDLLEALKQDPSYRGQIGEHALRVDEAQVPAHGKLDQPLSDNLTNAIKGSSGIEELYTHQAQAINALESGYNVIVSTSTSSGKSLIYQLPVLRALETDLQVRAMFIFPTKALAQDQKRALTSILSHSTHLNHVHVDTYDGDTPLHGTTRDYIRQNASIIFTNPDMVHLSILPGYKQWKTWLEKLRFVIVDELHYYSGAFGSHCAMIMRRLRRMCHLLGNDQVAFVSCSATVANPAENMANFFGLPASAIRVVDVDGAPTGRKLHLIWNPPLKDPKRPSQGRCSSLEDAVRLVSYLMDRGVRTICFAKVRQMCEILTKEMQTFLRERAPSLVPKVMSYRGGYTPEDRREIERKMFRGDLLCIVATNALELGVDIGSLDAVIHLGFPFNLASYRQQSGRAGRRERDSISILVAEGDNPLDQFYAGAPHELYDATVETVGVELSNELITDAQLQCAAYEWPIDLERDSPYFGDWESLEGLCTRYLRYDPTWKIYFAQAKYTSHPSRQIAIRSIDEDFWRIIDVTTHRDIEQLEASRVPFTLYEGSIFLHQGNSYHVFEVNSDQKCAKVRPTLVEYITRPRDYTDVDPVKTVETRTLRDPARFTESPLFVYYGEIKVTTIVFGYFKVNPRTKQRIAAVEGIENPPIVKHRFGFWVNIPDAAISTLRSFNLNVEYSIHAASHALISLVPSYVTMPTAGGGQTDIRTECKHPSATRKRPPRIIVYDGAGKGSLTYKAFKHVGELLIRAAQVVENCPCETGCPGCIHRASCTEHNEALTKGGALVVLKVTSAGVQKMG